MPKIFLTSVYCLFVLLLAACSAPALKPEPLTKDVSQTTTASSSGQESSLAQKWNKMLEAGKKEGTVVVYSTAAGDLMRVLAQTFQKNTGISVEIISGKGAEIGSKLIREHKAGLALADVYLGGATTVVTQVNPAGLLEPLEPELILPEIKDKNAWWGGDLLWIDKEHKHVAFVVYAIPAITVNETMVKTDEIKSYRDLLQPRWKGKIVINDPTVAGIGGKWFSIVGRYIMSLDYMRELAKQEPVILRDQRLEVDWLAKGRYPIGIAAVTDMVTEYRKAGAPLAYVEPAEGTWLGNGSGGLSLVVKAPHTNAARVFVNWMLTKEAQSIYSREYGVPSARLDVSTEGVDPVTIPKKGLKYVIGFQEEILIGEDDYRNKVGREIFGQLIGR